MTKEQALQIIKNLAAQYRGTLEEHNTLQQAVAVLEDKKPKSDTLKP